MNSTVTDRRARTGDRYNVKDQLSFARWVEETRACVHARFSSSRALADHIWAFYSPNLSKTSSHMFTPTLTDI